MARTWEVAMYNAMEKLTRETQEMKDAAIEADDDEVEGRWNHHMSWEMTFCDVCDNKDWIIQKLVVISHDDL
ncbi:hypothetical protein DYB37_008450 [Aphanomyces astaci]|uniref:Uncharacterized protein n=1 Tax=Aphanomyces astaci TaxID=112090 RepID=A0A3R6Y2E1_APHAT|nr:hypothetical protein DYB35_008000 [Aphanomyces astaci]RHZ16390.1 hypothetical protein DYB37_008450 [Aphanomyces astaci]